MSPPSMNWKSTSVVSGATLLATWLGWTTTPQPVPVTAAAAAAPSRDVRPVPPSDIEYQARRLQVRVRGEVAFQDPRRNPFRFGAKPTTVTQSSRPVRPADVAAAVRVAAPEFTLYTLAGLATDIVDGAARRIAIVSTASDLLFVKEGDSVGSYTATRVDEDGVELTAADGATHRLRLTP